MKAGIVASLALALAACGGWSEIKPTPAGVVVSTDPKQIERLLWDQFSAYAPSYVETTPEYFRVSKGSVVKAKRGFATTAMTTVENTITVYYASIGRIELLKKRSLYLVLLRDRGGGEKYRYHTTVEEDARSFAAAMEELRGSAQAAR